MVSGLPEELDLRVLGYASVAGILVVIYTFLIPLFQHIDGGLVAGLICGYRLGRLEGLVTALAAGVVTGVFAGGVAVVPGWLVGLFLEPNTLLTSTMGLLSVRFDITTIGGLASVGGFLVLGVVIDAVAGALAGDAAKATIEYVSERVR